MKTHLSLRIPEKDFEDIKTLAGLDETSMSAMLASAINYAADNPDVLTRIIRQLLLEVNHEGETIE